MPEQVNPESHGDIDIFISVNIPHFRTVRTFGDNRVYDFLPIRTEAGQIAVVCMSKSGVVRILFGTFRFICVFLDEVF